MHVFLMYWGHIWRTMSFNIQLYPWYKWKIAELQSPIHAREYGRSWVLSIVGSKTVKLAFFFFFLTEVEESKSKIKKNDFLGTRIICSCGTTCLSVDCCFNEHNKNPTMRVCLVYKADIVSSNCNLGSSWYSWQIVHFMLNNTHSYPIYWGAVVVVIVW